MDSELRLASLDEAFNRDLLLRRGKYAWKLDLTNARARAVVIGGQSAAARSRFLLAADAWPDTLRSVHISLDAWTAPTVVSLGTDHVELSTFDTPLEEPFSWVVLSRYGDALTIALESPDDLRELYNSATDARFPRGFFAADAVAVDDTLLHVPWADATETLYVDEPGDDVHKYVVEQSSFDFARLDADDVLLTHADEAQPESIKVDGSAWPARLVSLAIDVRHWRGDVRIVDAETQRTLATACVARHAPSTLATETQAFLVLQRAANHLLVAFSDEAGATQSVYSSSFDTALPRTAFFVEHVGSGGGTGDGGTGERMFDAEEPKAVVDAPLDASQVCAAVGPSGTDMAFAALVVATVVGFVAVLSVAVVAQKDAPPPPTPSRPETQTQKTQTRTRTRTQTQRSLATSPFYVRR